MRRHFYLLLSLAMYACPTPAQLVPCRPKMCMIDYDLHNDASPNADMTAIKTVRPDILIDNTPGGFWHGGTVAAEYTPLGIEVYSYIHGSYETFDLAQNLNFIDAIDADGATGVFFDEVSSFPDATKKAYLSQVYSKCQAKGLKLILNPGVSVFDPWLMANCDLLMSDEHYNGTRAPTMSEAPYRDRILVVSEGEPTADAATAVSLGARANGFGFSYACTEYIHLPSWSATYNTNITHAPATPAISYSGGTLTSTAAFGNQWYVGGIAIPGATSQTYVPSAGGAYHSIVTLQGCSSAASNTVNVTSAAHNMSVTHRKVRFFPDPVSHTLQIANEGAEPISVLLVDATGKVVRSAAVSKRQESIDLSSLPNGIYTAIAHTATDTERQQIVIKR